MDNQIRLDINHMMGDFLGMQYGIDRSAVDDMEVYLKRAHAAVETNRGKGMTGWMELPYNQEEIVKHIEAVAAKVRDQFDTFVVLGIGGSALGPAAVQQALNHLHYNDLPREKRGGPRLYIEDNIDPERMAALLDVIDLKTTCFNVISKSGGTAETMSQYLIILDALKREVGADYARHIIATTSENRGHLIKIANEEGYEKFYIPESVGGRFSELCPVGLLAAAVCGIDIRGLLEGARMMDERCKTDDVWKNPALLDAALMVVCEREDEEKQTVYEALLNLDVRSGETFLRELEAPLFPPRREAPEERTDPWPVIVRYIEQHYMDPNLTANEVAGVAGVDKTHLSRVFREHTGETYIEYLSRVRLERAMVLLTDTDMPVQEIVEAVGYYDHSSFRRKFKARYGISIQELRQRADKGAPGEG